MFLCLVVVFFIKLKNNSTNELHTSKSKEISIVASIVSAAAVGTNDATVTGPLLIERKTNLHEKIEDRWDINL